MARDFSYKKCGGGSSNLNVSSAVLFVLIPAVGLVLSLIGQASGQYFADGGDDGDHGTYSYLSDDDYGDSDYHRDLDDELTFVIDDLPPPPPAKQLLKLKATCQVPGVGNGTVVDIGKDRVADQFVTAGTTVRVQCQRGFIVQDGTTAAKCLNQGAWSDYLGICTPAFYVPIRSPLLVRANYSHEWPYEEIEIVEMTEPMTTTTKKARRTKPTTTRSTTARATTSTTSRTTTAPTTTTSTTTTTTTTTTPTTTTKAETTTTPKMTTASRTRRKRPTTTTTTTTAAMPTTTTNRSANVVPRRMKVGAAVATTTTPAANNLDCGISGSMTGAIAYKIFGGKMASPKSYPWMARLQLYLAPNTAHYCGATLISNRWLLTSASCMFLRPIIRSRVLLSSFNRAHIGYNEGERIFSYTRVIPHPNYDKSKPFYYNYALIELNTTVEFNQWIRPICLPDDANICDPGFYPTKSGKIDGCSEVVTAGWGLSALGVEWGYPNELRDVTMNYMSFDECKPLAGELMPNEVCAGGVDGKDTCIGDSGGPLMCVANGRHVLVGVTSSGTSALCGEDGRPGIYSRVCSVVKWIRRIVGNI